MIFCAWLLAAAGDGPIVFEDIAERAGVRFIADSSPTPNKHQPEAMLAGVALLDYDGDGYLDIFFANGASIPSLVKDGARHQNRLFRNNRDLTFTDVTEKAGVGGKGYGIAASAGDYDNDGRPDLYVSSVTANQLFRNNGDGTFTDVTSKAGVAGGSYYDRKMWSVAAAWFDYDNDGRLDLFVSNYCHWDPLNEPSCVVNNIRMSCSPRYYKPLPHTLYRNNGDGTFTDVSTATGLDKHLGRGMGIAVADYDADGYMDVFVANDDAPFQLFHNVGGKRFEEVAAEAGVQFAENGNVISGMGADFRDLFNTGRPSIWVTAVEKETFPLFVNLGRGQFADKTAASGLGMQSFDMSGWSNAIVDLDNDGWKDLLVGRSNVQDNIEKYSPRKFEEPMTVFRNLGNGRFLNATGTAGADFQRPSGHRGLAAGDLDNDGRVDAVVAVINGQARIFRNTSPGANHWLLLHLTGTKSNRMGIGARIRVTAADGSLQYNHATTSTGYAASSDPRVHFGLGPSNAAKEIEIVWPSGVRQVLRDVTANRILPVTEPNQ
jgi:hypothetical protein